MNKYYAKLRKLLGSQVEYRVAGQLQKGMLVEVSQGSHFACILLDNGDEQWVLSGTVRPAGSLDS